LAAAGAAALGLSEPVPGELPGIAQGSVGLWRVGIVGSSFMVFYVLMLAIGLAFYGRAFIEFGPSGVKAGEVVQAKQQAGLEGLTEALNALAENVALNASLTQVMAAQTRHRMDEFERRLDELKTGP